jgi:hypothetical protein
MRGGDRIQFVEFFSCQKHSSVPKISQPVGLANGIHQYDSKLPKQMKTLLNFAALFSAVGVLAQGTVIFNNRVGGSPPALVTHVYGPNPIDSWLFAQSGNGPNETPAGTVDWSIYTPLSGSGFTAQLFAAPGLNQPVDSLQPATPITSFRTGAGAGWVAGTTATLAGVPADAPSATLQLRVWYNRGGTITSWLQAMVDTQLPWAYGESAPFNVLNIGGQINQAPILAGLQSFNVHGVLVPEPATWALGGLSAALLVLFRRTRK